MVHRVGVVAQGECGRVGVVVQRVGVVGWVWWFTGWVR